MNEHEKDGLPFSVAAQRSEIEDGETSFTAIVEFNEFLIRRQLLAMESKEIEALRRASEDWLKSERNNSARLRDYALTFLRDHGNRMEELAKVENQKQKRTLKNLPRAAERLCSQKNQTTFRPLARRLDRGRRHTADSCRGTLAGSCLKSSSSKLGKNGLRTTTHPRASPRTFEKMLSRLPSLSAGGSAIS